MSIHRHSPRPGCRLQHHRAQMH
ncbi:hypothetical protein CGRA01v4_14700 [Colletotrichum graminicola]|nr:hypothetical protein CGRA01v4_14700 [Colletotrichum graminicola]